MNTETPIVSAINRLLPEKDCYGTDSQVATLNVITDHQRSYQLAYAHFLYSELGANPDCQHRLGSLADLDISLAFMTFIGLEIREEMAVFNVINSKAKGLNASLLDFHETKLLGDLANEKPPLYVAMRLNDDSSSPWFNQLELGGARIVGMARRASLRTMQNAVKRFMRRQTA